MIHNHINLRDVAESGFLRSPPRNAKCLKSKGRESYRVDASATLSHDHLGSYMYCSARRRSIFIDSFEGRKDKQNRLFNRGKIDALTVVPCLWGYAFRFASAARCTAIGITLRAKQCAGQRRAHRRVSRGTRCSGAHAVLAG